MTRDGRRARVSRTLWALMVALLFWSASPGTAGARGQGKLTAMAQEANLNTSLGTLHGTWLVPDLPNRMPVVLLVPDEGAIDRDGNDVGRGERPDTLRLLAEGLAARGVASLRYDKRGVGRSARAGGLGSDLVFEDVVNDAANIVDIIRGEARFAGITVVGHGQGALIGMLAARLSEAEGFVSIAGPANAGAAILRDRLRRDLAGHPEAIAAAESVIAALEQGRTRGVPRALEAVPTAAAALRRAVQPYLASWFAFLPTREIARLEGPVLIIQGTADEKVSVEDAQALKAARPAATLVVVPGMNHELRRGDVVTGPTPTGLQPIAADVSNAIAEFTRTVPVRPRLSR